MTMRRISQKSLQSGFCIMSSVSSIFTRERASTMQNWACGTENQNKRMFDFIVQFDFSDPTGFSRTGI